MDRRYPRGPQRLIHLRETAVVRRLLDSMGATFDIVLDCPCGHGRLTPLIKDRCKTLVSTDLCQRSIKAHRLCFPGAQGTYLDINANAAYLPFRDNCFDGTITFRLFHHLHDSEIRKKIFQEAARVSKNFMLISYYSRASLHELSRMIHRNKKIRDRKKAFLDSETILTEAAQAGWRHIKSTVVLPGVYAQTVTLFRK